ALRYARRERLRDLVWALACYFLSLVSKETAIPLVALVPIAVYLFRAADARRTLMIAGWMLAVATSYLIVRGLVLNGLLLNGGVSLVNNVLVGAPDGTTRLATAFYVLWRYVRLLLFPHPLVFDYSNHQVPLTGFRNPL